MPFLRTERFSLDPDEIRPERNESRLGSSFLIPCKASQIASSKAIKEKLFKFSQVNHRKGKVLMSAGGEVE